MEVGLHNLLNNDRGDYTTHGFLSRLVVSRELRGRFLLLTLRPKWLRMLPQPPPISNTDQWSFLSRITGSSVCHPRISSFSNLFSLDLTNGTLLSMDQE